MSLVDLLETESIVLNGHLITTKQAADILGRSVDSIQNMVNAKLLTVGKVYQKRRFVHTEEVELLGKVLEAYKRLSENIKEIYLLHREGAGLKNIAEEFNANEREIDYALVWYTHLREQRLNQYRLPEEVKADALFQQEVQARIGSSRCGHIPELVDAGLFREIPTEHADGNNLISYQSFIEYLAKIKAPQGKRLFRSKEVAPTIGITVEKVDIIAFRYKIGRKQIPGAKLSRYLFTEEEVREISRYK